MIITLILFLLSLAGFFVVSYIARQKKRKAELVCPLKGKCNTVVYSKYAKFLGLDLTVLGMAYYGALVVGYGARLIFDLPPELGFVLLGLSSAGLLFSGYLTAVQGLVLKQWCTWCVSSAILTTAIALISILTHDVPVVALLAEYKGLIVLVHALAAAVGVGATTVTDVSFTRYLKDFRIDQIESANMRMYSQVIWLALGVLILTGIGLYLPEAARLGESSKFLVKVIAVGVITLNGIVLNLFVTPRLTGMSFAAYKRDLSPALRKARTIMFASGAVSLASWYLVFILGSLRSIPLTFGMGLVGYVGVLVAAIVGSQMYEKQIVEKANKH